MTMKFSKHIRKPQPSKSKRPTRTMLRTFSTKALKTKTPNPSGTTLNRSGGTMLGLLPSRPRMAKASLLTAKPKRTSSTPSSSLFLLKTTFLVP